MGPVGIGLCAVFAGVMVVLTVEVFYILYRRKMLSWSTFNKLLELRRWRSQLQQGMESLVFLHHSRNRCTNSSIGSNPSVISLQIDASVSEPQASSIHSEFLAKLFPLQGDFNGDDDIINLQALLGPPRLLFTIREETREDLESEEAKSRAGRSRGTSRTSSEFLPPLDSGYGSACETPFHTPPSSPSLEKQEEGNETIAEDKKYEAIAEEEDEYTAIEAARPPYVRHLNSFMDDSCSSFSSTSSENITPPILASPRKPLSTLMEETSSSSSSEATPFALSPSKPTTKTSWESFLTVPSQIRVHPIEAGAPHSLRNYDFLSRNHLEDSLFLTSKQAGEFEHSGDLPSTPPSWPPSPHTWPPSPSTPPLRSALSSPVFISPVLDSILLSGPFQESLMETTTQQHEACLPEV